MRAVLDPNVLIAALLSPSGTPAKLVLHWMAGDFELVVSEKLLEELERALGYPRVRAKVSEDDGREFVSLLRRSAEIAVDPPNAASRSADPDDDYLLALAEAAHALLVSGDKHLRELSDTFPIRTPREFADELGSER